MKEIEKHLCFNGTLTVWEHDSTALKCPMRFSLYLPPQAKTGPVPLVTFLSGLTCTHENFTTKAGAYHSASKHGLAILAPDTSPRGADVPDDPESYDFGQGAGFYVNATQSPWHTHFQMETYITEELPKLLQDHHMPVDLHKQGIMGHSMGGHGALTLSLKYPSLYRSVSAFAPIVAPSQVPWGHKAFSGYLGNDQDIWKKHDACVLVKDANDTYKRTPILIDQGLDDPFLTEQLKPHLFQEVCDQVGQALTLREHKGYDHSYYFIQSFMDDHMAHHASLLSR